MFRIENVKMSCHHLKTASLLGLCGNKTRYFNTTSEVILSQVGGQAKLPINFPMLFENGRRIGAHKTTLSAKCNETKCAS